jgi:hypothetical protein
LLSAVAASADNHREAAVVRGPDYHGPDGDQNLFWQLAGLLPGELPSDPNVEQQPTFAVGVQRDDVTGFATTRSQLDFSILDGCSPAYLM